MSFLRATYISLLVGCSTFYLSAQTPTTREYQLKAVFLFNFAQFVDWPATSFSSDQQPLVIGVLGKNPFGTYLEETVAGEKVNGHPVTVQYFTDVESITSCHILFINFDDPKKREQAIEALKNRNILTVGDAMAFLNEGGMIRFFTKNNKIQFEIYLDATKEAGLVISSKLLRLAEIFGNKKNS